MIDIHTSTALLAGLLTFFAPCTLPLIPAFLGITAGAGFDSRRGVFLRSIGFVLGFLVVFMALGLFAGVIGSFFMLHREILMRVGGVIVIVFALILLDLIRIPLLSERIAPKLALHRSSPFSAFIVGFSFAFGWTPCLGPILGSILVLASTEGTALSGAMYLLFYGLGIAIPFLIFSLFLSEAVFRSQRLLRISGIISRLGGGVLLVLGLALLLGFWPTIVASIGHVLPSLGLEALIDRL